MYKGRCMGRRRKTYHLVDRTEDFVNLSDLLFVLKVNRRVEHRDLISSSKLDDRLFFARMDEVADSYKQLDCWCPWFLQTTVLHLTYLVRNQEVPGDVQSLRGHHLQSLLGLGLCHQIHDLLGSSGEKRKEPNQSLFFFSTGNLNFAERTLFIF